MSCITCGGSLPAIIFYKRSICTQVHFHFLPAYGAMGYQFRGDFHILLFFYHAADGFLIVIGLVVARCFALPEAIIALSVEQTLLVKAIVLEKMVYVGGQDKVVLVLQQ